MFTGIITEVGELIARTDSAGGARFRIASGHDPATVDIGASIAHDGCCLTVVDKGCLDDGRMWHDVELSLETLKKTTLGEWREGRLVNLERALRIGDELGGHIVSGHVDGIGEVVEVAPAGESLRVVVRVAADLARYIAPKGSVAVDGMSLTVNEVSGCDFALNIIPHTRAVTTWRDIAAGRRVNVEVDMLARYVARLVEFQGCREA